MTLELFATLLILRSPFLCLIDLFAVHDCGDKVCLYDPFGIVMQEIAVINRHVGKLSELDGTHAMLLMELIGHIDGHGAQRLLAGDRFFDIALRISVHECLRSRAFFRHIETEPAIQHRGNRIV